MPPASDEPGTDGGADLAVRVRGVSKTFGKGAAAVRALRGVDMDIAAGKLVMLVGPSGCGKTTLVSIISGVLDADEGEAAVYGVRWKDLGSEARSVRRGELVGFVFQQLNLIPTLTAQENVSVPLLIKGIGREEAMERSARALASVGLEGRGGDKPSKLSGGMQQRVAIARALVGEPSLLVCDEPTANLDARTGQGVMDLVKTASQTRDSKGRARTVLVVTHDARIFHYADEVKEMEDGEVKREVSDIVAQEARWVPSYGPQPGAK